MAMKDEPARVRALIAIATAEHLAAKYGEQEADMKRRLDKMKNNHDRNVVEGAWIENRDRKIYHRTRAKDLREEHGLVAETRPNGKAKT